MQQAWRPVTRHSAYCLTSLPGCRAGLCLRKDTSAKPCCSAHSLRPARVPLMPLIHQLPGRKRRRLSHARCQASDGSSSRNSGKPLEASARRPYKPMQMRPETGSSVEEDKRSQQAASAPDSVPSVSDSASWEQWKEFFARMDQLGQKALELRSGVDQAVQNERFEEAAMLQEQIDKLSEEDDVNMVMNAFEAALEKEDYELASNLRDRAGVGLCGWWACSKGDEPSGHLLWVEPAFGRFVGTHFSPRELAELTGGHVMDEPAALYQGPPGPPFGPVPEPGSEGASVLGSPLFELFVTSDQSGNIQQAAAVLKSPPGSEPMQQQTGEASGYTLEQGQDQQGNHIVQITMQNNGQQQGPRPGLHVPHPLRPWGGSRPLAGVGAAVSNGKGFLSGSSDESKILRMGHSGDSFRVAGPALSSYEDFNTIRRPANITMLNKDEFVVDVQPDGSASDLPPTLQLDSGSPGTTTVPIVIGGNVDKLSGNSKEEAAALAQFINESLTQAGAPSISTQALEEALRQAKLEAAAEGRPKRGRRGGQQQQQQRGLVEGVFDADQVQEPPQLPEATQREREERERELQANPLQALIVEAQADGFSAPQEQLDAALRSTGAGAGPADAAPAAAAAGRPAPASGGPTDRPAASSTGDGAQVPEASDSGSEEDRALCAMWQAVVACKASLADEQEGSPAYVAHFNLAQHLVATSKVPSRPGWWPRWRFMVEVALRLSEAMGPAELSVWLGPFWDVVSFAVSLREHMMAMGQLILNNAALRRMQREEQRRAQAHARPPAPGSSSSGLPPDRPSRTASSGSTPAGSQAQAGSRPSPSWRPRSSSSNSAGGEAPPRSGSASAARGRRRQRRSSGAGKNPAPEPACWAGVASHLVEAMIMVKRLSVQEVQSNEDQERAMRLMEKLEQTAQAVRPHLRGEVGEMAEEAEAESAEPDDAEAQDSDSSDDEAVEVHVTVDGAGMISSLQAQAPGSSDGGQGDAPLEKALQAVSQLFQSQGGTGQQEAPRELSSGVQYTRVPMDLPVTDPLQGLFVGHFGPHGPEVLQLERKLINGEEWVEALKLTGDANVPAGAVSFKARVGAAHRLKAGGAGVPEQFGVTCRFQGSGCVAQQGHQNANWVEGELLVFSDSGPVGRHHELGFMWHVPGDRNFLVLLSRLDLSLAHTQA